MSERIGNAQAEIAASLAQLAGNPAALALAETQLQGLTALQNRVAQAHGSGLTSIRNEVVAVAAAAQMAAQQARAASASSGGLTVQMAADAARRAVQSFMDDYYEKKIFDPYLRFASAEDEDAYRRREAERREAIEKALAEGTPEGLLRANRLAEEQLRDAGAHGADQSPDYAPMFDRIRGTRTDLETAIAADAAPKVASPDPLDAIPPATDPGTSMRAAGVVVTETDQIDHGVGLKLAALLAEQGRTT